MPYIGKKPADIIATAVDTTTGTFSGAVSAASVDADGGVTVDNITIDGTEIDLSSGDLTLDVAGDIILDADDGLISFKNGGTSHGNIQLNSDNLALSSQISDADIKFLGSDNGQTVVALTLDMSDAGTAVFNHNVRLATDNAILNVGNDDDIALTHNGTNGSLTSGGNFNLTIGTDLTLDAGGDITLDADGAQIRLKDNGTQFGLFGNESSDFAIQSSVQDKDILFQGNDGGVGITALTLDMSDGGAAIFNDKVVTTSINTASSTGTLTMFGGGTNKGGTIELSGGNNTGSTGSGIVFKTGASTSSPSEKMRIDQYGHVTMPNQSAFSARVASQQSNFALSSPVTVLFATEYYDQNSDYNNSTYTFTAPVTGKYQLNVLILLTTLDTVPGYYQTQLRTSNRIYYHTHDPRGYSQDLSYHNIDVSVLADMDAGDTAYVTMVQAGGTQQTDIDVESYFTGVLIC